MGTIIFDFEDGVINSYKSGWKGSNVIPDPPVPGIKEAIEKIRKEYRVVVVSSRRINGVGNIGAYLRMIAVIEKFRGQGIGRKMINYIEEIASKHIPNVF